jgi:hypothetical protein
MHKTVDPMMLATPRTLTIVGFGGNVHRPSRTRALIEEVIGRIAANHLAHCVKSDVFDVLDVMPELGQVAGGPNLPANVEQVIHRLETADAIVATSLTGAFVPRPLSSGSTLRWATSRSGSNVATTIRSHRSRPSLRSGKRTHS